MTFCVSLGGWLEIRLAGLPEGECPAAGQLVMDLAPFGADAMAGFGIEEEEDWVGAGGGGLQAGGHFA